jgi:Icc-related predicted phosphoesterase
MMKNIKIVCISDTHSKHYQLPPLPDGDVLIHAGDWSKTGSLPQTIDFLEWFDSQPHQSKLLIAGNHDRICEDHPHLFQDLLDDSITYLQDSGTTIYGVKFWGTPVTPVFCDWAFNRDPIAIDTHYQQIPIDTNVLISHGPPFGILDKLADDGQYSYLGKGQNVGCGLLHDRIKQLTDLKLMCCGHIHESAGVYKAKNGVTYINAAQLNEQYQIQNSPVVYDYGH